MGYFTRDELLKGRDKLYPLNQVQSDNLDQLIQCLDIIRHAYGRPLIISSAYRPAAINAAVGGAKQSAHMMCQAADIEDVDGSFAKWCMNNLDILKKAGILGMEDPRYTIIVDKTGKRVGGWVHLDIRGAKSGKFVFIPYAGPIKLQVR